MSESAKSGQRRLIQSIERAAAILEVIAREGGAAPLKDIADRTRLGKTTAHSILQTLADLGYVRRRATDTRYHLGGRILNLARIAGDDSSLRIRLRPTLEAIAERTGETVYLAVPSGDEVYYLDAIESRNVLKTASPIGVRERLEGSAIGLVFLAFMPGLSKRVLATRAEALSSTIRLEIDKVANVGFALDLESYQPGLHCVAVPWREEGEVRACLGLSGPSTRLPQQKLADIAWMMVKEIQKSQFL